MPCLPQGIIGSAGPTDHPAELEEGEDRHEDRSQRLADDVGDGVERHLAGAVGGVVSAAPGDERVRGLVAREGEQERPVPEGEGRDGAAVVHARTVPRGRDALYCPPWTLPIPARPAEPTPPRC